MLIIALVFGTAIIGCDNGSTSGGSDITYTVEANGTLDKDTSSQLNFTFSAAVSGLMLENIHIFDSNTTGKAVKNGTIDGTLTGDGTSWTLHIYKVTAGKIRVQITKDGVERGRKTVAVHKDSATGKTPADAIKLENTLWEEGSLADRNDVRWYKFEAEAGTDYRVQWRDKNDVPAGVNTDRIYVNVTAYESDANTKIDTIRQGIVIPPGGWPIPGISGTIYFKVEPSYYSSPGTFAIRFYDRANIGPLDKITLNRPNVMPNLSVELYWYVESANYPDPIESTGFKVYRSDTEDGTYVEIADVTEQTQLTYGPAWIYTDTDTNLTPGKTYWYKIAGYNDKGVGDRTEPREARLPEVDSEIVLTVGGKAEVGEIKTPDQVDWYKFEAESGKSYVVGGVYDQGYPAGVEIFAFKSDKTPFDIFYVGSPFSGVSGTVYLKVVWFNDSRNRLGLYGIKVYEE